MDNQTNTSMEKNVFLYRYHRYREKRIVSVCGLRTGVIGTMFLVIDHLSVLTYVNMVGNTFCNKLNFAAEK